MKNLIVVRGGGDLATGTIYKLHQCGFPVLILEIAAPSAIRRNVAFSEAVYQGTQQVENVTCRFADSLEEAVHLLENGELPLLVDPEGKSIEALKPMAVVDAIRFHTTGKAGMNLLEIIIYVADYMEPNRDFPGVEKLRALAFTDITGALKLGLDMTMEHLKNQGSEVSPESREALAYLKDYVPAK